MDENSINQKGFEQLNHKIDKLATSNSELVLQVSELLKQNKELQKSNKIQAKEFTKAITELKSIIKEKEAEVAKLKEQLNKDSSNSSKPSSTNFYTKPKPKPSTLNSRNRKGSTKKSNGGQKGHLGKTMELKSEPDAITRCIPTSCEGCPLFGKCNPTTVDSRNVVDVVIQSFQTQYNREQYNCPMQGGALISGEYPSGVNSYMQYGNTLKSLVVTLSSFGMMSMSRIAETVNALTGFTMSDSSVNNMILSCSNECKKQIPLLRKQIINSEVVGFDETGIRVCGKVHWMHTASTQDKTLLVSNAKRGKAGIDACGVLPHFKGVAVHDCWGSYYDESYSSAIHAVCGAHIDRELQGVIDNHNQLWAKQMKKLSLDMYIQKEKLLANGITMVPPDMLQNYAQRYDIIIEKGISRNPIAKVKKKGRGRPKKGKVRSLIDRLQKLKDDVLRFFTDFRVPFSNNIAERSYRLSKKKMQIAGTFRASDGGERFATIFSIIDTCRKNGIGPIQAMSDILNGTFSLDFLNQPAR